MGSLHQFSDHANASKARRRNLPTLLTETSSKSDNRDYGQLILSPPTAIFRGKFKRVQCTPITAVRVKNAGGTIKDPVIRSPSTPLRTTILERFLADTYEADALTEASLSPTLTLATAGISDTLPTPNVMVPWFHVVGSPPETNSDCFSPVLGTDSAEQEPDQEIQSIISFRSEEEPMSPLSIKSIQSSKSLPAWLPALNLNFSPRLGAESAEGQIQHQSYTAAQTESNPEEPAVVSMQYSPASTASTLFEEELAINQTATTVPPAISVPVTKTAWHRRNSFPQLLHKSKSHPKVLVTLPTPDQKGHPHPLRSAPFEAAVSPDLRIRSIDSPPTSFQQTFSEEFPASSARRKPAPIDTTSPHERIVSGKGKPSQMPPPTELAECFDRELSISSNNYKSPPPQVTETCTIKLSKVVRFAVVSSPLANTHFKPPPSPYPWPPRTFGGAAIASILTPMIAEFNVSRPFPQSETSKPTMADVLLDGTTPRGRKEQRLEKVGRLTRSVSPKSGRREKSVGPAILPNTVFECSRDLSYSTESPIPYDKNTILRTYLNSSKAAMHT